jgi:hypothetical protein
MEVSESNLGSPKDTPFYPRETLSMRARVKIPVAMIGQWKHPSYGEVSFTQEDLDQVKSNYLSNSLGYKPYLTFGHLEEEPNSTDSQRKRGDIEGFVQEGKVLFGLFDTPHYVGEMVRKGEYQYSSGEFIRNLMDKQAGNKLGCAVSRVALTNSPFIPFGEVRAQTLSQSMEGNVQTFTIELSQGADPNPDKEATLSLPTEPLKEPIEEIDNNSLEEPNKELEGVLKEPIEEVEQTEIKQEGVPSKPLEVTEEKKQEDSMTNQTATGNAPEVSPKAEEVKADPKPEVQPAPPPANPEPLPITNPPAPPAPPPAAQVINVEELIQQVRSGIQAEFQAERLQAQTVINNLQAEVNNLRGDLTKQKETAQVFSQTIARAQEEAQQRQLLSQGMPPVIVPKFIALHNAVMSGQTVMKLSMGAEGEKDITTLKLLQDVVSECLSMGGVPIQQMGTTAEEAPSGLLGDLKSIIDKNKQLANNK